jgi:putative spermidine/putrescine transport system substrate-binding protein
MKDRSINRRALLRRGAAAGLGLAGVGALPRLLDTSDAFAAAAEAVAPYTPDPKLLAAAKKEGQINVITIPLKGWADYDEIMAVFQKRFGIKINDANPNGSSGQEVQAINLLRGQSRGPDVVDLSLSWALTGHKQGIWQPYKVATWDTIPASLKEPSGLYYGDYWGIPGFMSVNSVVKEAPKEWDDLLSPKLRNSVSLGGDPRTAGEAFGAVYGAALANGGSLNNIQPGIDFFAKVKKVGNWNPTFALPANVQKGATPVAIRWDYLLLGARDTFNGNPAVTINIPSTGHYAGPYFQAISKYSPNPNAAKLWEEFLYSDEGQLYWLKGYTHPARYADLVKRDVIPPALAAKLPPAAKYTSLHFANATQIANAQAVVTAQWGPKVAGS